jgi:hypothetical protein
VRDTRVPTRLSRMTAPAVPADVRIALRASQLTAARSALRVSELRQVHVALASNDENAFAGVTFGVRVLKDVEQVATFACPHRPGEVLQ